MHNKHHRRMTACCIYLHQMFSFVRCQGVSAARTRRVMTLLGSTWHTKTFTWVVCILLRVCAFCCRQVRSGWSSVIRHTGHGDGGECVSHVGFGCTYWPMLCVVLHLQTSSCSTKVTGVTNSISSSTIDFFTSAEEVTFSLSICLSVCRQD